MCPNREAGRWGMLYRSTHAIGLANEVSLPRPFCWRTTHRRAESRRIKRTKTSRPEPGTTAQTGKCTYSAPMPLLFCLPLEIQLDSSTSSGRHPTSRWHTIERYCHTIHANSISQSIDLRKPCASPNRHFLRVRPRCEKDLKRHRLKTCLCIIE